MKKAAQLVSDRLADDELAYFILDTVDNTEPSPSAVVGAAEVANEPFRFSRIPKDLLVYMALGYDISDVARFCATSPQFNISICENEDFWRQKFQIDFPSHSLNLSANETYKHYYYMTLNTELDRFKIQVVYRRAPVRPIYLEYFMTLGLISDRTFNIQYDASGAERDGKSSYYFFDREYTDVLMKMNALSNRQPKIQTIDGTRSFYLQSKEHAREIIAACWVIVRGRGMDQPGAFDGGHGYIIENKKRYPLSTRNLIRLCQLSEVGIPAGLVKNRTNLEALRRCAIKGLEVMDESISKSRDNW